MTQEYTAKKVLLKNVQGDFLIPYTEPCKWGEITGNVGDQEDLQLEINNKIEFHNADVTAHDDIRRLVARNSLSKSPNINYIGKPEVIGSVVRSFSLDSYLSLPFVFDINNTPFELGICVTTGSDVTTEQHILCSENGILLSIVNSHFNLQLSSDGTSWDIGSKAGTATVQPNTTYYLRLNWNSTSYKLQYSTELLRTEKLLVKETASQEASIQYRIAGEAPEDFEVLLSTSFTDDIEIVSGSAIFPVVLNLGGSRTFGNSLGKPFKGSIDFEYTYLYMLAQPLWEGMDTCGLNSRANTSLSNLDIEGVRRIEEIVMNLLSSSLGDLNITPIEEVE